MNPKKTEKLLDLHRKTIESASRLPMWEEFCPKRYRVPKGYYDPAWFSTMMIGMAGQNIEGVGSKYYSFQADISAKVNAMLAEYMFPHYFLDRDLYKLMSMTGVTENIDLSKLSYPFNACLFSMPVGMIEDKHSKTYKKFADEEGLRELVSGAKSYVSQIGFCRTFDVQTMTQQISSQQAGRDPTDGRYYDKVMSHMWSNAIDRFEGDEREERLAFIMENVEKKYGEPCRIVPSFNVCIGYDTGDVGVCSYPIEEGRGLGELLKSYEHIFTYGDRELDGDSQEVQDEVGTMQALTKLCVTLILYMSARSDEYSKESKRIKFQHKGRTISNLYSPNFLGAKYRGYISKQNKLHSTGKMKPHWRAGHLHTYWTGKGRTKPIQKWVMPYAVNIEQKVA